MKKALSVLCLMALLFSFVPAYADISTTADLFRYIPTCITVSGDEAKVEGYFVNLSDEVISNIRELELSIYMDDEPLIEEGRFSGENLEDFELKPCRAVKWTFTYANGGESLNDGVYVVPASVYADFSCKFSRG